MLQQPTLKIDLEVCVVVHIRGELVVPNVRKIGVGLGKCCHTLKQLEHQRVCTHTTRTTGPNRQFVVYIYSIEFDL
jgi:hypothetical protein